MELHRRPAGRHPVELGSATLEGVAAVGIVFVLFVVMAQASTAFVAHRSAQAAVAASASRLAISGDVAGEHARLLADLRSTVPGATGVEVRHRVDRATVSARARFVFNPPGPLLEVIRMEVSASAPIVSVP